MSDDEIERAIRDAAEYEASDGKRRSFIDARNEAEQLVRRAEVALSNAKKTLDKFTRKQIKSDISYLKKLIGKIKPGNVSEEQAAELNRAKAALEQSAAGIL